MQVLMNNMNRLFLYHPTKCSLRLLGIENDKDTSINININNNNLSNIEHGTHEHTELTSVQATGRVDPTVTIRPANTPL